MKPTRYVFCQDQDSHWYMVPEVHAARFRDMCEHAYANEDFEDFYDAFESMRCASPTSYSFVEPERYD